MPRSFVGLPEPGVEPEPGPVGFWSQDFLLQLWLWLVAGELNGASESDDLDELVAAWRREARRYGGGCVSPRLDRWASTQSRRDLLRDAGARAARRYAEQPMSVDEFRALRLGDNGAGQPPSPARVGSIAERWDDLLAGTLETTAGNSTTLV